MSSPFVSYFLRPNAYAGTCAVCDGAVPEGEGFVQKADGRWQTLCDACAWEHGRFVPLVRSGQGVHGKSVVKGSAPLGYCTGCHATVGLVRSAKTGRFYLADTFRSYNPDSDAKRVYDFRPHHCKQKETA